MDDAVLCGNQDSRPVSGLIDYVFCFLPGIRGIGLHVYWPESTGVRI